MRDALAMSRDGRPVFVEVAIDYSRKTYFTRGVVATTFWRLPWADRLRMLGRAVGRHVQRRLEPDCRDWDCGLGIGEVPAFRQPPIPNPQTP